MTDFIENKQLVEQVVLVGIATDDGDDTKESLDELAELAATAGAVYVGTLIQNREGSPPWNLSGQGKSRRLKELTRMCNASGVICDDEAFAGTDGRSGRLPWI